MLGGGGSETIASLFKPLLLPLADLAWVQVVWNKNIFSTPSPRRDFLATMGKEAALAGLRVFGAGSEAAFPLREGRLGKIYSPSWI